MRVLPTQLWFYDKMANHDHEYKGRKKRGHLYTLINNEIRHLKHASHLPLVKGIHMKNLA